MASGGSVTSEEVYGNELVLVTQRDGGGEATPSHSYDLQGPIRSSYRILFEGYIKNKFYIWVMVI